MERTTLSVARKIWHNSVKNRGPNLSTMDVLPKLQFVSPRLYFYFRFCLQPSRKSTLLNFYSRRNFVQTLKNVVTSARKLPKLKFKGVWISLKFTHLWNQIGCGLNYASDLSQKQPRGNLYFRFHPPLKTMSALLNFFTLCRILCCYDQRCGD